MSALKEIDIPGVGRATVWFHATRFHPKRVHESKCRICGFSLTGQITVQAKDKNAADTEEGIYEIHKDCVSQ